MVDASLFRTQRCFVLVFVGVGVVVIGHLFERDEMKLSRSSLCVCVCCVCVCPSVSSFDVRKSVVIK